MQKIHAKADQAENPKRLLNNFEKVQKTTFLTPKFVKMRVSTWQKVSIFRSIFTLQALFLACWNWKSWNLSPDSKNDWKKIEFSPTKFLEVNSPHTTSAPNGKGFIGCVIGYRVGWLISETNQNPMDFSLCMASAGPQRRASVMSSKEYKYFTLKFSNNKNPR